MWEVYLDQSKRPLYKALAKALEHDIRHGRLKAGDKLPPVRELADHLSVNASTVANAFKICTQKGLIHGTVGRGTYVSAVVPAVIDAEEPISRDTEAIDLGIIRPLYIDDASLLGDIREAASSLKLDKYFSYRPEDFFYHQQATGRSWLKKFNVETDPDNVVVTFGTQNALTIILTALFQPGDKIGTDSYTYFGLKSLVGMLGIRLVPIASDADGLNLEALDRACKTEGLKAVYIVPECHNPTTHTLSGEKRREIAGILKRNDILLIEDAIYAFLGNSDSDSISSFMPEKSFYISGTSKALTPDIRVAFMSVPKKFQNRIKNASYSVTLTSSNFDVEIIDIFMRGKLLDRIIADKRAKAEKRSALAGKILGGYTLYGNKRDFFRWLVLPDGKSPGQVEEDMKKAGVLVLSSEVFAVGAIASQPAIRISLSAARTMEELKQGLEIVDEVLSGGDVPLRRII